MMTVEAVKKADALIRERSRVASAKWNAITAYVERDPSCPLFPFCSPTCDRPALAGLSGRGVGKAPPHRARYLSRRVRYSIFQYSRAVRTISTRERRIAANTSRGLRS
jgi:hypothetical protein